MEGFKSLAKASRSDCADCNCVETVEGVPVAVNAAAVAAVARRMVAVVFIVEYYLFGCMGFLECCVDRIVTSKDDFDEKGSDDGIQTRRDIQDSSR
jgi:hypothetical protein